MAQSSKASIQSNQRAKSIVDAKVRSTIFTTKVDGDEIVTSDITDSIRLRKREDDQFCADQSRSVDWDHTTDLLQGIQDSHKYFVRFESIKLSAANSIFYPNLRLFSIEYLNPEQKIIQCSFTTEVEGVDRLITFEIFLQDWSSPHVCFKRAKIQLRTNDDSHLSARNFVKEIMIDYTIECVAPMDFVIDQKTILNENMKFLSRDTGFCSTIVELMEKNHFLNKGFAEELLFREKQFDDGWLVTKLKLNWYQKIVLYLFSSKKEREETIAKIRKINLANVKGIVYEKRDIYLEYKSLLERRLGGYLCILYSAISFIRSLEQSMNFSVLWMFHVDYEHGSGTYISIHPNDTPTNLVIDFDDIHPDKTYDIVNLDAASLKQFVDTFTIHIKPIKKYQHDD